MGILDDAIREHLDLKRKHGARDAELEQLEDEAFGPPTRPDEPDFPERPPTGEEEAVVEEAATEEGVAQPAAEEPEPFAAAEPPAAVEPTDSEPGVVPFFDQESEEPSPPPASELEPAPPSEPAVEPEAIVGEPTVEHPAPEPPGEEGELELAPGGEDEGFEEFREAEGNGEEEGEDVLEETPEFLRDTPENERLWFEQGEPQDFDFDDEDGEEDRS